MCLFACLVFANLVLGGQIKAVLDIWANRNFIKVFDQKLTHQARLSRGEMHHSYTWINRFATVHLAVHQLLGLLGWAGV